MASVRVAVRVRPLNKREKQSSSNVIIHIKGDITSIHKPVPGDEFKDRGKSFSYDFSYDSSDRRSPTFASQERIFQDLGSDALKAAFEGFNVCIFAYGQTGSGKSYTMMGHTDDKGLIPRICGGLFSEISRRSRKDAVSFCTEVSYLEIYNERVQDLLRKRSSPKDGGTLKVREHPLDGPYVENLSKHLVHGYSDIEDLMVLGNANRSTASTGMNNASSRSHAIFTIRITQARLDPEFPHEMLSKIHLVDLAGSERSSVTGTTGSRLKEGANINKSLVTLGSVISALADLSVGGLLTRKTTFVPYRDSVLTWLLRDSLGGNSVTTMIATVSPADVNYNETLSTLRYASRAKNIVNSPKVNEDGSAKVIRELQAEVVRLHRLLEETDQVTRSQRSSSVKVEEEEEEKKVLAMTQKWTSRWSETRKVLQAERGAPRREPGGEALHCQLPHLIGVDEGPLSTGIILYHLKEGRTPIGTDEALCRQGIVLCGPGLQGEHCVLENRAGTVSLIPQEGALCSVNGSVVTGSCQLTQGAIVKLGKETMLVFNRPTEDKVQTGPPSASHLFSADVSGSSRDSSEVMRQNPGQMDDGTAEMAGSKVSSSGGTTGTTERHTTTAKPGKYPVPHVSFDLDGDALQRRLSTRDGQEEEEEEEERDSCHKSAPGLPSERRWRKAQSGPRLFSSDAEDFWSRDASLQQTSVLGPGDGCGAKPEGNGNEMQGVAADCYGGRPGSSGSSLGSMSHLQGSVGSSAASVLPRTRTPSQRSKQRLSRQAACCPLEETTLEGQFDCGEMDEWGGTEEIPGVSMTEAAAATGPDSRLASLVSRVSWIAQDVGHLLWNSSMALEQVRREGLRPAGARWSCCVLSLLRESNVLSVVKDSRVFSVLQGSVVFSMFKNSLIYSLVKKLPLMPDIQGEMTQNLLGDQIRSQIPVSTPRLKSEESPVDVSQSPGVIRTRSNGTWAACSTRAQEMTYLQVKQEDRLNTESLPLRDISERTTTHSPEDGDPTLNNSRTLPNKEEIQMSSQTLIEFPESLLNLQTLPLLDLMDALQSVIPISVLISQKIVAVYWLNVAKSSQPVPCPGLLILVERGLYTLTSDSGLLVLFHHLPWLQLKEVQISLGGHSLRLMGSTKESILGVYTHNQNLTKELSRAILGIVHPWDNWFSQHPLLHGDLMKMSLDWETYIPDLLLDAGLRVCCQFQKSLADLVYLLHCNMDQETVSLGQLQLLLYTGVAVCLIPSTPTEYLTQLLLTDTHLGLVQEDAVFYPPPPSVPMEPVCPQFHDLTLCRRSDVRCMLVHDEDERGAVRLDVIIANVRGRGHPESETRAGTPSAHASNSSPHAEVWKLTFSCSSEADCLINHLSNG